jgi:hypothetical protein
MLALLSVLRRVSLRSRHDPRPLMIRAASSSAQRADRHGKGQSTPSRPVLQPLPPPPRNVIAPASQSGLQSGRREIPRFTNVTAPITPPGSPKARRLPLQLSAQPWLRRHDLLSDFDRSTALAHSLSALPTPGSLNMAASGIATSARHLGDHPARVLTARFRASLDLAPPWPHFEDTADDRSFPASSLTWSPSPLSDPSLENPVLELSLADFRASCANVRQHAWTARQYAPTRFHSYTGAANGGRALGMRVDAGDRQRSTSVYENAHAALNDSRAAYVNAARAAHTRGRLDEVQYVRFV